MIKIVHVGDLHLGGAYPEKAEASIDFLIEQMNSQASIAHDPDMVICTGDTTEKPLHVHSDHLRPLLRLVRSIECPMIFLQGTPSHEPYGFLNNLQEASGSNFTVIDTPTLMIQPVANFPKRGFLVTDQEIAIAALPAINKPMLYQWAKNLGLIYTEPDDIIRHLLAGFAAQWADFKGPKILLGHWTVNGCQTASGQTLYGSDMSIGLDDLALAKADITLLGHIHKRQTWTEPALVTYCGSAHPCNWGELDEKSFNVINFNDTHGYPAHVERVKYPHKPMMKVDVVFTGKQLDGQWEYSVDGQEPNTFLCLTEDVELKVCYSVPQEIAAQVDDMYVRVMFKQMGIDVAMVDRTLQSNNRERIENITSKETTRDQYEAVCKAKGMDPRPGALAKADQVDERAVAA